MRIVAGDLADPRLVALARAHHAYCHAGTPAGSAHALDLEGLARPDIAVFAGFDGETLVAMGALRRLADGGGEVKAMHTRAELRGSGAGAAMLAHIVAQAKGQGLTRLSLETGAFDLFHPARRLYRRHGFRDTGPFGDYRADPNSAFLTLNLGAAADVVETRASEPDDLPAMLSIYNHVVATSTAIYRDDPTTLEERAAWRQGRLAAGFPVIVAARGDEVLGFASYGEWRGAFPGYRHTVEHSVHVAEAARGAGVGAALMNHLLDLAREAGVHVMVGAVDADNSGSLRFHERLGFASVAHFHEVGTKFGGWLDLVFVEKRFA